MTTIAWRLPWPRWPLRTPDRSWTKPGYRPPLDIYTFDNGPRHTIGFEPDTRVVISRQWPVAKEWLGTLMALVRNESYDPGRPDGAVDMRGALCRSPTRLLAESRRIS